MAHALMPKELLRACARFRGLRGRKRRMLDRPWRRVPHPLDPVGLVLLKIALKPRPHTLALPQMAIELVGHWERSGGGTE